MLSDNSIIIKTEGDSIIFYQTLLKKGVLAEVSSLTLLGKYLSENTIDESISVNAKNITGFSLSDCLLDNPSGVCFDSETTLDSFQAIDFVNLLYELDILIHSDKYLEKYGKKTNLFDNNHIGNFHQQIGSFLLTLRKDPEMWWVEQKFEKNLSEPRNNPYKYVQEAFMNDFFESDLEGQSWLDFGCGIGFYTEFFSKKNAEITGYDPSEKYIEIAKENFSDDGKVNYMVNPFENNIDFDVLGHNKFDAIFMSDVFLYYFEPYKELEVSAEDLLTNLKKCLRPNGRIYIMDPHGCFHLQPWFGSKQPFLLCNEYKNRQYRVTPNLEEVSRVVENSGLLIRKIRELTYDHKEGDIVSMEKRASSEFPLWWFFELSAK